MLYKPKKEKKKKKKKKNKTKKNVYYQESCYNIS